MDVNLQNAYTEVLLDNFVSVIKQNVMFQAQLEIAGKTINELNAVAARVDQLAGRNAELETILQSMGDENGRLKTDMVNKNTQVQSTETIRAEKYRLQAAVNEYMRKNRDLEEQVLKAKSESSDALLSNQKTIEELNKYIQRLESVVPANKLKKVKTSNISQPEQSDSVAVTEVVELDNIKSGGSF